VFVIVVYYFWNKLLFEHVMRTIQLNKEKFSFWQGSFEYQFRINTHFVTAVQKRKKSESHEFGVLPCLALLVCSGQAPFAFLTWPFTPVTMEFAEFIKVTRVDNVLLRRSFSEPMEGTLCITGHHLILSSRRDDAQELFVST
jgi:hypothetical protein